MTYNNTDARESKHVPECDKTKNDGAESLSSLDDKPSVPFLKVVGLAKPEYPILFVSFILMALSEGMQLYIPVILAEAYNDLIDPSKDSSERMAQINRTMVSVLLFHCGAELASFIRLTIMQIVGERVVARLRLNLYQSILRQDISFFDRHKSGELASRLGSDTALLQQGTSQSLPESIVGVMQFVVAIALMLWISAKLALIMIAFCIIMIGVSVPFGSVLSRLTKNYQNILGEAQSSATEALQAMRTVQSFGAEECESKRYEMKIGNPKSSSNTTSSFHVRNKIIENDETTYSVGYKKALATSGFWSFLTAVGFGGMYITLWYGFKLVNEGEITLGDLTAFQSYFFIIGGSLGLTAQAFTQVLEAMGVSGRIFYLLERKPAIPGELAEGGDTEMPCEPFKPSKMEGTVDFNNVVFAYPSRPSVNVLKEFSVSIKANETVAFVGSSGSGKSTSLALLQRFYDVNMGSITIDGHDIRKLDLQWLRNNMAYVQQEPQLFGFSVRENIVYGVHDREVSQLELEAASRQANAHEFISSWPLGYDTLVGERGVQLSGGQKQRIAIARALVRNPRILLLDEATSALDAESEHFVQEAIDNAVVGRTVLIVAHRLSTIQRANQIVVVDDHCIVDIGTHSELLNRCTKYQDLISRQKLLNTATSQ